MTLKLSYSLLAFVGAALLARYLGSSQYGLYAYVLSLVTILSIPAQLGLPQLVVRETAKLESMGDQDLLHGLRSWAYRTAWALSLVVSGLTISACFLLSQNFDRNQIVTMALACLLIPTISLGNIRGASLRGLRRITAGMFPEYVLRPGAFVILVLATMALGIPGEETYGAAVAMALNIVAAFLALLAGAWILHRISPQPSQLKKLPAGVASRWLRSTLPITMTSGLYVLNSQTDTILLGIFGSASDVGIYRVAIMSAGLVSFGLQAVNLAIGPHFARTHTVGDPSELRRLMALSSKMAVLVGLPIAGSLVFFGQDIVKLVFGSEYVSASGPLIILCLGQLANVATGSVGSLLIMTGEEVRYAKGIAIAVVANLIIGAVLIQEYGMIGAAISNALCFAGLNIFWAYEVHKKCKAHDQLR